MPKVKIKYLRTGKIASMDKRYAEVLVKQKHATYVTTEAEMADGSTYQTREMKRQEPARRQKGRGKAPADTDELVIGNVYDVYGYLCYYADFEDNGQEFKGMIKIRDLPEEVVADLVVEGKITQAQSDAVGGGLKRVNPETEVKPDEAVAGAETQTETPQAVEADAKSADDKGASDENDGASAEKNGNVAATGETAA